MPLQRRILLAALVATSSTFAATATLAGDRATQLASVMLGSSALSEPFAHIEPSPAPAEPTPSEAQPEPTPAATVPAAAGIEPAPADSGRAAAPADPGAGAAAASVPKPVASPDAVPAASAVAQPAASAQPAAPRSMKGFESPLIDPSLPIPEPVILSEPQNSDPRQEVRPDPAPSAARPVVRVPTAAERAVALARIEAAKAEQAAHAEQAAKDAGRASLSKPAGADVAAGQAPVQLAAASAEPPDVLRSDSPAAATLPPKIVNVPAETQTPRRRHLTADRDLLLREFPDELVESLWLQDWQDIERGYMFGRLVDVPSDPEGRGIVLRLDGESRIGELTDDPYRQMLLCKLAKPAAGLLYRVASRLRMIEGEAYEPLEITSLVRTWDYQLRLSDVNPNADRTRDGVPPTHVLGLAFDIARSAMSVERQERVESLLDQLAIEGDLAYYKEGSQNGLMHYHVIALPSANFQLARHFEREQNAIDRRQEAQARHRTLPDSPCVMFGNSLEPFSAICSCELPAEVSTAWLASAPISR